MSLPELSLIAVSLSVDAFAVAVCFGLSEGKASFRKSVTVGIYFGFFQAMMPLIGYLAASQFSDKIVSFDHWIAFVILLLIGLKMIKDSYKNENKPFKDDLSLKFTKMLPLATATSIDALAVGISFAFLQVNIIAATVFIGITTLILSASGVKIGNVFGEKYQAKAEIAGGSVLILIGLKILLEHSGLFSINL
ncbi:MAG: manganese efflux pump MntP family protein [Syntrophomonadaceae bacterium]|jgi:putative Mn2+ efflux pump MntP|nr:manganese efflux pump MntP family protein [Syntrophomonadaceae bacterium]